MPTRQLDASGDPEPRSRGVVYVIGGVLIGGLLVWGLQALWTVLGDIETDPTGNDLKQQLMRRKSDAMHDLLDAMVRGRLGRVEAAAGRVEANAESIEDYLSTDIYEDHGREFFRAVKDVRRYAGEGDLDATKKATLRLEAACLDCHAAMSRTVEPEWRE